MTHGTPYDNLDCFCSAHFFIRKAINKTDLFLRAVFRGARKQSSHLIGFGGHPPGTIKWVDCFQGASPPNYHRGGPPGRRWPIVSQPPPGLGVGLVGRGPWGWGLGWVDGRSPPSVRPPGRGPGVVRASFGRGLGTLWGIVRARSGRGQNYFKIVRLKSFPF